MLWSIVWVLWSMGALGGIGVSLATPVFLEAATMVIFLGAGPASTPMLNFLTFSSISAINIFF